ncbi:putative ammonium transporter 1 isoform X1 [Saccostrea cucullata]|uniref:putative ammonium transporter 1 isoform X1 n=1 Tax=Saccostrea cuccullata TaxID=36930 RepID=UPI002ED3DB74
MAAPLDLRNITDEVFEFSQGFVNLKENVDNFFLFVMGMIVFFMQCGFAFLEAGAVRSKNTTNILIKNVMDLFISGVSYWLFGFAFAFGDGVADRFIGLNYFASSGVPHSKYALFFFQFTFAATASTIVSGAVAERCEFVAYFVYSVFITGFIYPVVTHWAWSSGGWLTIGDTYSSLDNESVGYQDFAGSGVVHVLGGIAAFMGAVMLGPRIGRFHRSSKTVAPIRGHSVPIAALGGFILFFGFLAFNGGSQLSISNPGDGNAVSIAVVNTVISGSCAAFMSLILNRLHIFGNTWSLLVTINGALTGMVAICAGCNVYEPYAACVIGLLSAIVYRTYSVLMVKIGVDDPLDAVAVHFGGGSWGVIAVAFFDNTNGIFYARDLKSAYKLGWQFIGLLAIAGWTLVLSGLVFGIMKAFGFLRVSQEEEIKGLDIPKHNEPAYPVEAYGHGHIERLIQILENNPTVVTQGFTNVAYENEITDRGNYENPETQNVLRNGYQEKVPSKEFHPSTPANGVRVTAPQGEVRVTVNDTKL